MIKQLENKIGFLPGPEVVDFKSTELSIAFQKKMEKDHKHLNELEDIFIQALWKDFLKNNLKKYGR